VTYSYVGTGGTVYGPSSTAPTAAGSYTVTATINDSNYQGSTTGTLTIGKATASTITLGSLAQTYTGSPLAATATTVPSSLAVTYSYVGTGGTSYGPSATAPTAAGSYTVTASINDSNYQGSNTGTLTIGKATASAITLGSLAQTYTGSPLAATATTTPSSLAVTYSYVGTGGTSYGPLATAPTAAGSYTVTATINDSNYQGSTTGTLTIGKATASVVQTVSSLTQTYNGSALSAAATTLPSGLALTFTYNGSTTMPTTAGIYTVVGTINNSNYQGSGTWSMVIAKAPVTGVGLVSSANPAMIGPITLTATVSSSVGTPSGTVSFMDSSSTTPLGQVAVSGGLAALSISTLTVGSHTITAVYSGDANFSGTTSSTLTQSILDFSVNPGTSTGTSGSSTGSALATQTVVPGSAVSYTLSIAPTAGTILPVPVTLTVSGMPAGATATVTPSTWSQLTGTSWSFPANTPLNAITLTVQVPSTTAQAGGLGRTLAPFSLALLLLPFAGRMRRAGKRLSREISLLLLLMIGAAAMTALSGCGSTNGFFGQPQKTYTITATVTSGTVSHSTNLTLTVQ